MSSRSDSRPLCPSLIRVPIRQVKMAPQDALIAIEVSLSVTAVTSQRSSDIEDVCGTRATLSRPQIQMPRESLTDLKVNCVSGCHCWAR